MNAERVADAFEHALLLDASSRDAFLRRLAEETPDIHAEVESLLAADFAAGGFLETPIVDRDASSFELPTIERAPGEMLGPYRILRKIGTGGMSDVYLAERQGPDFALSVAIKVIRSGLPLADMSRRLIRERRLLATLRHPNIAQLLDGGTAADGHPFLVMEYIDGVPIDQYCQESRLSVRRRLELFRTVCEAVAYAHHALVVHRDLKPSNILVDSNGVPRLLDFGIAKLLRDAAEEDADGRTAETTAAQLRLLTPRYASPEQMRGDTTTTATDVYSLGVLLYELLTGTSPYGPVDGRRSLEEAVLSTEPPLPSRHVRARLASPDGSARDWAGRLSGDLDTITMMALRKEPGRRYASVEQLSADIDRHLRGLPVVARADTLRYRVSKFTRRNLPWVAAATIVFLAVSAFAITTAVQLRRTADERDRANREAATARQTTAFIENIFRVADPLEARGREVTAREILARGLSSVRSTLDDQPEVKARLLRTLGSVHLSLGLYDVADSLLTESIGIFRFHSEGQERELASALDGRGHVAKQKGSLLEAVQLAEEALAIRETHLGKDALQTAQSLNNLAVLKLRLNEPAAALALFERALAIREKRLGDSHNDVAGTQQNLGNLYIAQGDVDRARDAFLRARTAFEVSGGSDHPGVAAACAGLARIASEAGEHAEAESLQMRALRIKRKVYGAKHEAVATDYSNLALVRKNQRDFVGATAAADSALSIYAQTVGMDHEYYAETLTTIGELALERGDPAAAKNAFSRAREILVGKLPTGHPSIARTDELLARVSTQQGEQPLDLR